MEVENKRIGVYGFGITGEGVVRALLKRNVMSIVFDDRCSDATLAKLDRYKPDFNLEAHLGEWDSNSLFRNLDLLVISPGIRIDSPKLDTARSFGVEVISEIEFAWRVGKGTVIAVTGTNGKSTTTALTGKIIERAFAEKKGNVYTVGNIGKPYVEIAFDTKPEDVIVVEVSSFQLEAMPTFHPHVAIYTNITDDHKDRHGTLENYASVKRSMVERMTEDDYVIFNYEDESLQPQLFPNERPQYVAFTSAGGSYPEIGAWLENGEILVNFGKNVTERYPQSMIKLRGLHNVENTMCALMAARLIDVNAGTIIEAVEMFEGFPHRIEFVRELSGVRWYNDSKATNPESTITALRAFDEPIVLILGGRDKGTPLDTMCRLIRQRVEKVILLGEAADRFDEALRNIGFGNIERVQSLVEAIKVARRDARPGRVVLFSPACASFDMFTSFEERGNIFRQLVKNLPEAGV